VKAPSNNNTTHTISAALQQWYMVNKRSLPWRGINNAYHIWLSEIILQQTRVAQGLPYYINFITTYPTVQDLAAAPDDDVLKLWQGLGYYSRARNLHAAAKMVVNNFNGIFPTNYNNLISLKGVGEYTASAIASFTSNEAKAVVDGNVYRVLSRVFDVATPIDSAEGVKLFKNLAYELLPADFAGEHNQAIMELGATCCTPQLPKCGECPLTLHCNAYSNNTVMQRPIKTKKTKVRTRYFYYLIITDNVGNVLLQKRPEGDIWQGLYEFVLLESDVLFDADNYDLTNSIAQQIKTTDFTLESAVATAKHLLSHQRIYGIFCTVKVHTLPKLKNTLVVNLNDVNNYPLPRLIDKHFNDN
jgi:A/G-specific adenine glycosylase